MRVRSGFIWPRIGSSGELSEHVNERSGGRLSGYKLLKRGSTPRILSVSYLPGIYPSVLKSMPHLNSD